MYKITILYGAVRDGRLSIKAAKAVQKALQNRSELDVKLIDLRDYELPVMEARLKDMDNPPSNVVELGRIINESDGLVFVSPEYNNSYSGAMKNMVDYFTTEWGKKPIGIVAASSGKMGGINASNLMQLLVLAIKAFPMPTKMLFPNLATSVDEDGNVQDEGVAKGLERFTDEYIWFVSAIADKNRG